MTIKSQARITYSKEETLWLSLHVPQYQHILNQKTMWKTIAIEHNKLFLHQRKSKDLKRHYNNCIDSNLKKTPITFEEEKELSRLIEEHGVHFRLIGKLMGRTENSVKNYFNKYMKNSSTNSFTQKDLEYLFDQSNGNTHLNTSSKYQNAIRNSEIQQLDQRKILENLKSQESITDDQKFFQSKQNSIRERTEKDFLFEDLFEKIMSGEIEESNVDHFWSFDSIL
jgi:hypothetical protein